MSASLKESVEAIVNPIRAFEWRKARFREELLAYLIDLQQECTGDVSEALRRFGEPTELRRELQGSVPLLEQVAAFRIAPDPQFARRLGPIPGEPALRYGIRIANWILSAQLATCFVSITYVMCLTSESFRNVTVLGRPVSLAIPLCAMCYLVVGPLFAFRGAVALPKSKLIARGIALSGWLLALMVGFGIFEGRLSNLNVSFRQYLDVAAICLIAPWAVLLSLSLHRSDENRRTRWRQMTLA
jgi:hypothetical protein